MYTAIGVLLRLLLLIFCFSETLSTGVLPIDAAGQVTTADAKLAEMEKQMEMLKTILNAVLTKAQDSNSKQTTMSAQIQELKSRDEKLIQGLNIQVKELIEKDSALTTKQKVLENQLQSQSGLWKELKEEEATLKAQQNLLKKEYETLELLVKSKQSAYENRLTESENNIQLAVKLNKQKQETCRSCQEGIKDLNATFTNLEGYTTMLKVQQNITEKNLQSLDKLVNLHQSTSESRLTHLEKQFQDYNQTKECGCQGELNRLNATCFHLYNEALALYNTSTSTAKPTTEKINASCLPAKTIGAEILVAKRGNVHGMWSKDPLSSNHKVYYLNHYDKSSTLLVYLTEANFKNGANSNSLTLPVACDGANGLVYGGKLYCNEYNTHNIVAVDLTTMKITGRISFSSVASSSAGNRNKCHYQWGGYSDFDIEADETGLWVIWGREADSCNIALGKLNIDGGNLFIQQTWLVPVSKNLAGNAFMVCGVLYLINSYSANPTFVKYQYDTRTSALTMYTSSNGIQWRNYHGYLAHVHYDPREKSLIVWDNGYQSKLPITFQ